MTAREIRLDLCGFPTCLSVSTAALAAALVASFRPCIVGRSDESDGCEVERLQEPVLDFHDGTWSEFERHSRSFIQLEDVLLKSLQRQSQGRLLLHCACIEFAGRALVVLAPSGGGKSSLSRALLALGGGYSTDDLLLISDAQARGLTRAIQFAHHLPKMPVPPFLKDCDLETLELRKGRSHFIRPVWWREEIPIRRSLALACTETVVVLLERGPDAIAPATSLERHVALHEATITSTGVEYDGCLGTGPTFRLLWTDPDRAATMLLGALGIEPRPLNPNL